MHRGRIRLLLGLLLALFACPATAPVLAPAAALADVVATTGDATSVTATSAELNGVVDPSDPDAVWFFEYGRSPDLASGASITGVTPLGRGLHAVAALVGDLAPATTYYFRVGAAWQADTGPGGEFGAIGSFRTSALPRSGQLTFPGGVLRVRGGVIPLVLGCRGRQGAACAAMVSLTLDDGRARGVRAGCGTGVFIASGQHRRTLRLHPGHACLAALRAARGRRSATLRLTAYPARTTLVRRVTLSG